MRIIQPKRRCVYIYIYEQCAFVLKEQPFCLLLTTLYKLMMAHPTNPIIAQFVNIMPHMYTSDVDSSK